ncbi:Frag1/DRAM/Sfk1 family-domain-containing protein [Microdochium trichocladiopsis]|uniref:Frag1/DRAM/Sfk1 family-domain-containing protein n=1 Tax=Microdochium trichocladiopsis TaxID=1682393 RepID=A0A9P8XYV4_9PEZI|nr:Frag1/DRAM/Sfk1 family-domain-containing protein [Microdochium trichocladiopsis]KAH7025054.1 Frag1/DRAM/Sfk1 family-domain-containing protein [Microdochium trichocladiopsis]
MSSSYVSLANPTSTAIGNHTNMAFRVSYWVIPIFSGLSWLVTLLALLLYWIVATSSTHYSSMSPEQTIAFISDVGASTLKPLFVTGCILTSVLLDASFLCDWFLRRRGRLLPNETRTERVLSGLTVAFAVVGMVGLCCLAGFDTARFPRLHLVFLFFFIVGYLISAVCICAQYRRLGKRYLENPLLRTSYRIKLAFVVVEFLLAVTFVALLVRGGEYYNRAAVVEWVLALVFSFYAFSFAIDLYPAAETSTRRQQRQSVTDKNGVAEPEYTVAGGAELGRADEEMAMRSARVGGEDGTRLL